MKRAAYYAWIGILGLLVLVGLYSFYLQTVEGHYLTGTSPQVPWGIYISAFAFFVGASAGATMVGLMIHAFERDDYKPIGTRAILISLLCIFAATLFIMADVGNPLRTLKVPWILRNPNSLFLLSSTSYYIFMALLLAELYYAIKIIRGKAGDKDKKIAKWLGIIAVPYALWVVHAFTGSIFGVIKSREYWNTPLVPAHFVSSALATGVAIVILVTILTSKITKRELVDRETLDHMGKLLAFFLVVTIFFDFFDSLVLSYSEIPEGIEAWRLLTGKYAPLFVLTIGGMFVALLILLFKQGRTIKGLSVASSLTLVAIAAYRYNLVIVGQLVPLLPGIPEIHYSPTGIEISVTVGIVALVMLLYTVLTKVLPMEETVSKEVV